MKQGNKTCRSRNISPFRLRNSPQQISYFDWFAIQLQPLTSGPARQITPSHQTQKKTLIAAVHTGLFGFARNAAEFAVPTCLSAWVMTKIGFSLRARQASIFAQLRYLRHICWRPAKTMNERAKGFASRICDDVGWHQNDDCVDRHCRIPSTHQPDIHLSTIAQTHKHITPNTHNNTYAAHNNNTHNTQHPHNTHNIHTTQYIYLCEV